MRFGFLLLLLGVMVANAESVIFPTGQTNTITVNAGEVIFISQYSPSDVIYTKIAAGGITNAAPMGDDIPWRGPRVLAGPIKLIFKPDVQHFFNYRIVTNVSAETMIVRSNATNVITIPAGKKLRFFTGMPVYGGLNVRFELQIGSNFQTFQWLYGGDEFAGPVPSSASHNSARTLTALRP